MGSLFCLMVLAGLLGVALGLACLALGITAVYWALELAERIQAWKRERAQRKWLESPPEWVKGMSLRDCPLD